MCYSVYAWHGVLISKLNYVQTIALHSAGESAAWFAAYFICLGLVATTTFVFVEFPSNGVAVFKAMFHRGGPITTPSRSNSRPQA